MKKSIAIIAGLSALGLIAQNLPQSPGHVVNIAWDYTPATNGVLTTFTPYEIVNGTNYVALGSTTNLSLTISNVLMSVPHTYTVVAVDGFGNVSAPAVPVVLVAIGGPNQPGSVNAQYVK